MIIQPVMQQNPSHVLHQAGLRPKKSWGQNFLCDAGVLQQIALASGAGLGQPIVELGAGTGALTLQLLQTGADVWAVERDRDLIPLLKNTCAQQGFQQRLHVLEHNAARLDYAELALLLGQTTGLYVAGNLPYQLSGRILVALADAALHVQHAVLLVQQEVAARLVAPPGGRTYGLLSVLVQRAYQAHVVMDVAPAAFYPVPRVDSSVVVLQRRPIKDLLPPALDRQVVAVARASFAMRRKTLRNTLAGALGLQAQEVAQVLAGLPIDAQRRAETLDLAEFAAISTALSQAGMLHA